MAVPDRRSDVATSKPALKREWEAFVVSEKHSRMLRIKPRSIAVRCDACQAPIYRIIVNGKPVDADCDVEDGVHPGETSPGYGVSHVSRCPARQIKREERGER